MSNDARILVELTPDEAEALVGWRYDDPEAAATALDRIERALRVETGTGGTLCEKAP